MTVAYNCVVDVNELTAGELSTLTNTLDKERYEWDYTGEQLIIAGEAEVDSYSITADDVANEIGYILWHTANLDADINTEEVEHEPDWDKMPCGYDTGYHWN